VIVRSLPDSFDRYRPGTEVGQCIADAIGAERFAKQAQEIDRGKDISLIG
jgi:hypothetical protein